MEIVDSCTYRNGGTTYVIVEIDGEEVEYAIDYALPHDGRDRHVSLFKKGKERLVFPIGSREEREACQLIRRLAEKEFGNETVLAILSEVENPVPGSLWFYVSNFLRIANKEGKYA
jgi:hypothetical protein